VGTGFRKGSRTNKKLERDDASTENHPALTRATGSSESKHPRAEAIGTGVHKVREPNMPEVAADRGECSRDGLCSSIAERGRVAGAIKTCFASIGFCGLAAVGPAFAQAPKNGDELARMMITQAESNGGHVDMHRFGDAACFVAEGLSAPFVAHRRFPGYTIAYKESDGGNGLWFVLLADHATGSVRLYAVRQSVLPWNVPENTRVADAMVCTSSVDISTSSATGPELVVKPGPRAR
jgi:hypothetical protein